MTIAKIRGRPLSIADNRRNRTFTRLLLLALALALYPVHTFGPLWSAGAITRLLLCATGTLGALAQT